MDTQIRPTDAAVAAKKSHITLIIIGIVAVLLIAMGVLLFFVLRGKPAADITFYDDRVELIAGETQRLDYAILPNDTTNKSVKWESSNPSIADVSEAGEITAINEGEAIITVITSNGKIDECLVSVKPTAFDYLKRLSDTAEGYTVGNYRLSNGSVIKIGLCYLSKDDTLYIINDATGDGGNGYRYSSTSTIAIPSSLSGEYGGYLEYDYGFEKRFEPRVVRTTYLVNSSTLTPNKKLSSHSCDGTSYQIPENEAIYTSALHTMLTKVYQETLEPNGYTYADLGFDSYS